MTNKTNQTFVYAFEDKNDGGYAYIELDHGNKKFTNGNSRTHQGHHKNNVMVNVKRKKDVFFIFNIVDTDGWEFVETFN